MAHDHPAMNDTPQRNIHSHTWIVGVLGLVAGLLLLVYVPSLKAVSGSILLFAGFHLVGGIVVLASLYIVALRQIVRRILRGRTRQAAPVAGIYDFGWGPEWMNGLAVGALVAASAAVAIQVAAPAWWPLAFLVLLLAAAFSVGNSIMRSFRSADHVVLPMVDFLQGDHDLVLDAGCGAGRTTIALSKGLRNGRVVAIDRFDADYIDDGGRTQIEHNLRAAGLSERVRIETADLTDLPFDDISFDSAISTNVYDHLGRYKEGALHEIFRVLKPGGRFLMAVWVPGGAMFAVANILSFFLTSRAQWRAMARRA
ncbi:MAG: class I SAM-dependent methyltransferase, partial [Rhodospirillales bacterium]|nr:class I SAM-dependent methyltransferase [Rhodospirillales bacterium]